MGDFSETLKNLFGADAENQRRKLPETINAVEAAHRQLQKLTKTKGAFPNESSLLNYFKLCCI